MSQHPAEQQSVTPSNKVQEFLKNPFSSNPATFRLFLDEVSKMPIRPPGSISPITPRQGAVILITGSAGVGKFTTASALHKLLNPSPTNKDPDSYADNSSLIHNHLTIDPALALIPRGSADKGDLDNERLHMAFRCAYLTNILEVMARNPDKERIFVITAVATMAPKHDDFLRPREMEAYIELARRRGAPFAWFRLSCSREEHKKRIEHADRQKSKLRNLDELEERVPVETDKMVKNFNDLKTLLKKHDLLNGVDYFEREIETTFLSPKQSAEVLLLELREELAQIEHAKFNH